VISFIFDEQTGRAGMRTRLEAFVDLLVRRREVREAGERVASAVAEPATAEVVCLACPLADACARPAGGRRPPGCVRTAPQAREGALV
jgi:hypothetical protein